MRSVSCFLISILVFTDEYLWHCFILLFYLFISLFLGPLLLTKLSSRLLPFSFVHDMSILLSSAYSVNYKQLAGELGYNYSFVKTLESQSQPVETLLDHYVSGLDPTKERLYEALIKIGRYDVAQKVWLELWVQNRSSFIFLLYIYI